MATESTTTESDGWLNWADRDTAFDILVNVVPLGILLFFTVLYAIFQPWGYDPFYFVLAHFLTVFPFLMLTLLTYFSARVISRDEEETPDEERPTDH